MALARRSFVKAGQKATNMGFAGGGFSDFLKDRNDRIYGFKKGSTFEGKILPAFDLNLPEGDLSYPTSVVPYRERHQDAAGQQPFTSWFARYYGYRFFRPSQDAQSYNFLSPLNMAQYHAEDPEAIEAMGYNSDYTFDPILKMCEIMRRKDSANGYREEYEFIFTRKREENPNGITGARLWTLFNAFVVDANNPSGKNVVMVLGTSATDHLLAQLDLTGPTREFQTDDPDFFYLYEDVTRMDSPKYAFFPDVVKLVTQQEASVLSFGKSERALLSTRLFDYSKVTHLPKEEILRSRVDLLDIKQFDWWSTQRIVDMLIQDGRAPLEFLERVLEGRAVISQKAIAAQKANRQYYEAPASSQTAPPAQTAPVAQQQAIMRNRGQATPPPAAPAPAQTPPAPAQTPPPPAQTPAEREFWVTNNGQVQSMSESELKAFHASGFNGPVMLKTDSTWATLEHYGLKSSVAPSAPPAAPAPAAETPAPASPPAAVAAPPKRFGGTAKTAEQTADDLYGSGDDDIPFESPKPQQMAASPASSDFYKDAVVDVTPEMEERIKELYIKSLGRDASVIMTVEECAEFGQLVESVFGVGVVTPPAEWCEAHGLNS